MLRTLILATALASALSPAAALGQSEADRQALIRAIAEAGCRVNAGNNAAILRASGLSEDAAGAVVESLIAAGLATPEGGDLVLRTAGC